MNLPTEVFGDVIVVHTPEELGHDQADEFKRLLERLTPRQVVIDLDRTELLDSQGLAAMLDAQDELRTLGGNVKVATGNAVNRKILELTRIDRRIETFASVIDAVKSYR